jgi:hypothetical protein
MIRLTAVLLVVMMAAVSGRLLVCDYSCVEHTRTAHASQPACHEQEAEPTGPVFNTGQNDCVEQPVVVPAYLAGKTTTLVKPAPALAHAADARISPVPFARATRMRAPRHSSPVVDRTTPLRI